MSAEGIMQKSLYRAPWNARKMAARSTGLSIEVRRQTMYRAIVKRITVVFRWKTLWVGSAYWLGGTGRLPNGIMHAEHAPPASSVLSAHSHPMSGEVLPGSINPEIVRVPQDVAEDAHIVWRCVIMQSGRILKEALAQITHNLLTSPVLTMLSIENDLRVKALRHRFRIPVIEGDNAGFQIPFCLGKCASGISRLSGRRKYGNSPLQIDGHSHIVEHVHTQDSVDLPSTRLADG